MDACRANNRSKVQSAPVDGGNRDVLCDLVCCQVPAEEFTMQGFKTNSGPNFIAMQLILDFDRKGESPLLKPDVTRIGISHMPSTFCEYLTQVLYVLIPMQKPSAEMWQQHNQW